MHTLLRYNPVQIEMARAKVTEALGELRAHLSRTEKGWGSGFSSWLDPCNGYMKAHIRVGLIFYRSHLDTIELSCNTTV